MSISKHASRVAFICSGVAVIPPNEVSARCYVQRKVKQLARTGNQNAARRRSKFQHRARILSAPQANVVSSDRMLGGTSAGLPPFNSLLTESSSSGWMSFRRRMRRPLRIGCGARLRDGPTPACVWRCRLTSLRPPTSQRTFLVAGAMGSQRASLSVCGPLGMAPDLRVSNWCYVTIGRYLTMTRPLLRACLSPTKMRSRCLVRTSQATTREGRRIDPSRDP